MMKEDNRSRIFDNENRTKADVIRNTRHAAQTNKSRTKVYGRIKEWEENNIGTDNEEYVITLHPGWSFEQYEYVTKRTFSSVALAMRGVSGTHVA